MSCTWTAGRPSPRPGSRTSRPPNLFAEPGEYTITCHYDQPKGRIRSWAGSLVTKPERLTVTQPEPWGKAVDGVPPACGWRSRSSLTDPLTFDLDLRNDGTAARKVNAAFFRCELILDGRTYGYTGDINHPLVPRN